MMLDADGAFNHGCWRHCLMFGDASRYASLHWCFALVRNKQSTVATVLSSAPCGNATCWTHACVAFNVEIKLSRSKGIAYVLILLITTIIITTTTTTVATTIVLTTITLFVIAQTADFICTDYSRKASLEWNHDQYEVKQLTYNVTAGLKNYCQQWIWKCCQFSGSTGVQYCYTDAVVQWMIGVSCHCSETVILRYSVTWNLQRKTLIETEIVTHDWRVV